MPDDGTRKAALRNHGSLLPALRNAALRDTTLQLDGVGERGTLHAMSQRPAAWHSARRKFLSRNSIKPRRATVDHGPAVDRQGKDCRHMASTLRGRGGMDVLIEKKGSR